MKALIFASALLLGDVVLAADETLEIFTTLQIKVCEKSQNCTDNSTPGEEKIVLHEDNRGRLVGASTIKSTVAGVTFKFIFAIIKDHTNTYTISAYYSTGDVDNKENQPQIIGRYFVTDPSQIVEHAWFGPTMEAGNATLTPYLVNSRIKDTQK